MRMIMIAFAALAVMAGVAQADGLPYSTKDTPTTIAYNHCYVRGFAAGESVIHRVEMGGVSIDGLGQSGLGAGAGIGCDHTNGLFVFGLFGDYTYNKASFNVSAGGVSLMNVPFTSEWSLGGRVGVLTPSKASMIYGLAAYTGAQEGGAMGKLSLGLGNARGYGLGVGIETKLTEKVTGFIEARHVWLDTQTSTIVPATFDTTTNRVLVGMALHFGGN